MQSKRGQEQRGMHCVCRKAKAQKEKNNQLNIPKILAGQWSIISREKKFNYTLLLLSLLLLLLLLLLDWVSLHVLLAMNWNLLIIKLNTKHRPFPVSLAPVACWWLPVHCCTCIYVYSKCRYTYVLFYKIEWKVQCILLKGLNCAWNCLKAQLHVPYSG